MLSDALAGLFAALATGFLAAQTLCGNDVEHVIVQGKKVVIHKKVVGIDERRIIKEAEARFVKLMNRSGVKFDSQTFPAKVN